MPELFDILDIAALRLADGPVTRTYANGSYSILDFWNDIVTQGVNMTASTVTNSITVNKAGLYEVTIAVNADFASNEEMAIYAYVNGVQDTSGFVAIQGAGIGRPVELHWAPLVALTPGMVVDLRGTNRDPGSVEVQISNAQFRMEFKGDA